MRTEMLTDGTVTLSPPTPGDIPAITRACQDPDVARWTTVPAPYETEHARGFVSQVAEAWQLVRTTPATEVRSEATWAVSGPGADDAVLGMVGLRVESAGSAELGYWLTPAARGRGVMTRAVRLALDFGFADDGLELDRVTWSAFVGNWASWAVAWRCGFRFEGQVGGHCLQRGERRDAWVATLERGDPTEPTAPWPATTLVAPVPPEG